MIAQTEPRADAAEGIVGTLSHPEGPALTVRTVTNADVEGLDALFQGLPSKDRYHRFFHFCHPARRFLEQLTRAEDEGGYRLVAAVSGAGGNWLPRRGMPSCQTATVSSPLPLPRAGKGGGWDAACSAPWLPPRRPAAYLTCKPTSWPTTPGCLPCSAAVAT